jgi:hypothetical protein
MVLEELASVKGEAEIRSAEYGNANSCDFQNTIRRFEERCKNVSYLGKAID